MTCLEIKGIHILSGSSKGYISLWDIKKQTLIWSLNLGCGSSILAVKFLKNNIIWSDTSGNIAITEVTKGLLGYNVNHLVTLSNTYAFSINQFVPNPLYPSKLDSLNLIAIPGIDSIQILNYAEGLSSLWSYSKEDCNPYSLPYIDWGYGALPEDPDNAIPILAIAWDKLLQLIKVIDPLDKKKGFMYAGYYKSKAEITSLYWASESVILITTSINEVKILYTGDFTIGEYSEDSRKETSGDLEKEYKEVKQFTSQLIKVGEELRISYHQTTTSKGRHSLYLTQIGMLEAKLYKWNEFLEDQRSKNSWINVLMISAELYSGNLKGFAEVSQQRTLREEALKASMKNFLWRSIIAFLEDASKGSPNASSESMLMKVQLTIEFCILISSFDLLFRTLFETFDENNLENLFIEALEPFILAGKFTYIEIPTSLFNKMLDYYKDHEFIEQVLLSLCLTNQNLIQAKEICISHKLYSALIYISTIEDIPDNFIEPLIYLSTERKIRKANNDQEVNYLGYKLMWYIDLCFKGLKYPHRQSKIYINVWPTVIYTILNWMFLIQADTSNMKELMSLDITTMLKIFRELFENETTRDFIKNPNKYKAIGGYGFDYTFILNKIKEIVNDLPNATIEYNKFIGHIATLKEINIECIDIIKQLPNSISSSFTQREAEELIIGILEKQYKGLRIADVKELLKHFSLTEYKEVMICLWKLSGEHTKCIDEYLAIDNSSVSSKIFDWLQNINKFLEDDVAKLNEIKGYIQQRIHQLLKINVDRTVNLIKTWFEHQHESIIDQLKDQPSLQLEYIEKMLNEHEGDILKTSMFDKDEKYNRILSKHLQLLCDLKPKEVISYIKKEWYPIDISLEICKSKELREAVAYLLKQSGLFTKSLNTYLDLLYKHINDKEEFKRLFEEGLKVCKENAKVRHNEENQQEIWFNFLDKLYELVQRNDKVVNECIKKLLNVMSEYVSLPSIIKKMIDKHSELGISSFKDMFSSMLLTYFYQEKVLGTAKGIIAMEVSKQFHELKKAKGRATFLKHSVCSKCNDPIQWNIVGEAIAFNCGHFYHAKCVDQSCYTCLYGSYSISILHSIGHLSLYQLLKRQETLKKKAHNKEIPLNDKKEVEEKKVIKEAVKKGYMERQKIFETSKVKSFHVL